MPSCGYVRRQNGYIGGNELFAVRLSDESSTQASSYDLPVCLAFLFIILIHLGIHVMLNRTVPLSTIDKFVYSASALY